MRVKNYLLDYNNLYIYQDTEMFNFSLDSVLLANFVTLSARAKKILDIGCGNAPIPLILSTKTRAMIIGVEIQKEVYELAKESVLVNNLNNQIIIVNDDIREYYKEMESDSFDAITCNPPFFKANINNKYNDSSYKTLARHEVSLTLDDIILVSRKLLKNGGVLSIVHRPDRLVEILLKLKEYNLEPKRIRLIYPGIFKEANILLIEAIKNGRPGLKILPPLFVHDENGEYTEEVRKMFKSN